jgi:hypothetical protein
VKADHKTVLEEQGLKREVCTDGTRVKILEDIIKWANNRSLESPSVFWLTSQAGSSKTTIVCVSAATSVKKARLRPLSEQLLGRSWPRPAAHDDDEGQFILFYLIYYFVLHFIAYRSTFNP